MTGKEIENCLRDSIRRCDYASIEELAHDARIGVPTIRKFLKGGDILFSDAARLIATSRGQLIMDFDLMEMRQNLLEEIDTNHCIYIASGHDDNNPDESIYFDEIYPPLPGKEGTIPDSATCILTGVQNLSLKTIERYILDKKSPEVAVTNGGISYKADSCVFLNQNPYSKTAKILLKGLKLAE